MGLVSEHSPPVSRADPAAARATAFSVPGLASESALVGRSLVSSSASSKILLLVFEAEKSAEPGGTPRIRRCAWPSRPALRVCLRFGAPVSALSVLPRAVRGAVTSAESCAAPRGVSPARGLPMPWGVLRHGSLPSAGWNGRRTHAQRDDARTCCSAHGPCETAIGLRVRRQSESLPPRR